MNNVSRVLLTLTVAIFSFSSVLGSTCNSQSGTSGSPANWNATGTWSCGAVPANGDVINVSHYVNSASSLSYQWATSTITITGNVTITGNLDLYGSGEKIIIDGGTLTVTGTLTVSSQASITIKNGGTVNAGAMLFDNNATATFTPGNSTIKVTNALTINGSAITTNTNTSITAGSLSVTNSGGTSFTNNGTISVTGNVSEGGAITNNSGATFNVGGNLTMDGSGSSVATNSGTFNVTGNTSIPSSSKFYDNPGGVTTFTGNVTTSGNQNLIVGTAAAGPPYADVVIKGNLASTGSGDVLVDQNGRLAVLGNVTSDGSGGSIFTFNKGSQVYVQGTSTFNGGGDKIKNNNTTTGSTTYVGFYTNNPPTYPGGGSTVGLAPDNTTQLKTDDPTFFTWLSGISGTTLPVTLTYFEVKEIKATSIALAWETASEINFDHFVIEKSSDGVTFATAGTVKGHGTTNISHEYKFEDTNPSIGKNYYRLKSVDFDGYTETFSMVYAPFEGQKSFTISPNPTDGNQITTWVNFAAKEDAYVTIFDSTGSTVDRFKASSLETEITFTTPLQAGLYYAKYTSVDYTETVRFVVR